MHKFHFSCDSINPEIDIGQVEGAFTMGLGYWLTEKMIFDPDSGQLLTHNTWVSFTYIAPSSSVLVLLCVYTIMCITAGIQATGFQGHPN